jgi:hypothetical protein
MKLALLFVAGASLILAGCDIFTKSFNDSFDTEFRKTCPAEMVSKGVDKKLSQDICGCMMDTFQKSKKSGGIIYPNDAELNAAAEICVAQITQ